MNRLRSKHPVFNFDRHSPRNIANMSFSGKFGEASEAVPLTPYTGIVASRCLMPNGNTGTSKQVMSRSAHYARDTISSLQLVYSNWRIDAGVETNPNPAGTITYSAAIEYPEGVFTQVLWSGLTSVTIANGADSVSDAVTVAIANGALFWVRTYGVSVNARVFSTLAASSTQDAICHTAIGEIYAHAASGITDQTMGGTITGTTENAILTPSAIIGTTTNPSFFLIGDSRCFGVGDTRDSTGDWGSLARSIGSRYGYCNAGSPSANASDHVASHTKQVAFADAYCSHILSEYGINDVSFGDTLETIQTALSAIWGYYTGKTVGQVTLSPRSSSLDSWATTGQQTTVAQNTVRASVNQWLRSGVAVPIYDTCSGVEDVQDNGIWKATGAAFGYTRDGTHESRVGYLAEKDVLDLTSFSI